MKALILAAGYATRLRPLTDSIPKQLLPVGGRPMVDWILDGIEETSADEVHLVTNARFADDFERWAEDKDVRIHNDGTTSNEDRLGAIGDIRFVGLDDDLLVVAGDNLFDYSLADYEAYWRHRDVPLRARACAAGRAVPRRGKPARPAWKLHRLAAQARARLRVLLRRTV